MIGQEFERLTVVEYAGMDSHRRSLWKCLCVCGNEKIIRRDHLLDRHTQSCGCLPIELGKLGAKHGHCRNGRVTPEHTAWAAMMQRCYNSKHKQYKDYGGRGIKVCKRWHKFENFLEDMGIRPGKRFSIDRIKNDEGYCLDNCRWATKRQQARNHRRNVWIEYNGREMILQDCADLLQMSSGILRYHLKKGKTVAQIIEYVEEERRLSL
jgi:hypothetical protein